MKRLAIVLAFTLLATTASALEVVDKNDVKKELKESNFHLGLDLQTKYLWRGMEMMVNEASPVVFPCINYSNSGFYLYLMGGYSINGKYSEVDMGLSYSYEWITIGINDYYYPTTTTPEDQFFNFNKDTTGHWLEAAITIAPEKIPVYMTVSNFFYGADKYFDGNQAYSTYAELGGHYDFLNNNQIALTLGAAFNKSCYNGYQKGFGMCNLELKYTHNLKFENDWTLPLSVAFIVNPIYNKSHVNFQMSFSF